MSATPPIVVASTPWTCRVFDRNAARESADAVAGAGTSDGGATGDCARTCDGASSDGGAADGGGLLPIDEITTAEVAGAAAAVVAAGVVAAWPLAVTRGLAREGVGEGVATGGTGFATTATAHSVFGYPSMPHTSPASAPVPIRTAAAAARTSAPVLSAPT